MKSNVALLGVVLMLLFGCAQRPLAPQAGRVFMLKAPARESRFVINLPSEYAMEHHEGPDFDVYHFSDASGTSRVGVYVGCCPGLHSKEAGITLAQPVPGRIGQSSVEWLRWIQDGKHHSEVLISGLSDGLILHVFIAADTQQKVLALEEAAATLRLERAR